MSTLILVRYFDANFYFILLYIYRLAANELIDTVILFFKYILLEKIQERKADIYHWQHDKYVVFVFILENIFCLVILKRYKSSPSCKVILLLSLHSTMSIPFSKYYKIKLLLQYLYVRESTTMQTEQCLYSRFHLIIAYGWLILPSSLNTALLFLSFLICICCYYNCHYYYIVFLYRILQRFFLRIHNQSQYVITD